MSTLTDKLPKLHAVKLPDVKLPDVKVIDLDEAKKPLFAAVGVVDLYVEQFKDIPAEARKAQGKVQAKVEATRAARTAQFKTLPTQVKDLRAGAKTRVAKAQTDATALYGKLAARGEKLVTQIRRQPATEAAIAEGKAAVKKAEAAATSAKKATKSTEKAVEGAASKIG
ncbi:MAG: hypothetical protein JWM02_1047 [Frankiales bacterium]|nr:hypothetical protein [Frankiales bacterium]